MAASASAQECGLEPASILQVEPAAPTSIDTVFITAGTRGFVPSSQHVNVQGSTIDVTVFGTLEPGSHPAACATVGLMPIASGTYTINYIQVEEPGGARSSTLIATSTLTVADAGRPWFVSVVPKYPIARRPLSIRITAGTGNSPSKFWPHKATVAGNTIRVEGCYSDSGFAVPGTYTASAGVPPLPAGRYRAEYYRTRCTEEGNEYPEPYYAFYTSFDVDVQEVSATWPGPPDPVMPVAEYYHAEFGHYFITADETEQVALESRVFSGWAPVNEQGVWYPMPDWERFGFWRSGDGMTPVCRFFSVAFAPKSSHFYTADSAECQRVQANPDWIYEGVVGYVLPASPAGECAKGVPLFRLYNAGRGGAPSHRYVTQAFTRDAMTYVGWVNEGTFGCVPLLPFPWLT